MNLRLGVIMCSSLPLLYWFMESISELFSAAAAATSHQPLIGVLEDSILNTVEDDVSTAANVAAQKHFQQSHHHMFQL